MIFFFLIFIKQDVDFFLLVPELLYIIADHFLKIRTDIINLSHVKVLSTIIFVIIFA